MQLGARNKRISNVNLSYAGALKTKKQIQCIPSETLGQCTMFQIVNIRHVVVRVHFSVSSRLGGIRT